MFDSTTCRDGRKLLLHVCDTFPRLIHAQTLTKHITATVVTRAIMGDAALPCPPLACMAFVAETSPPCERRAKPIPDSSSTTPKSIPSFPSLRRPPLSRLCTTKVEYDTVPLPSRALPSHPLPCPPRSSFRCSACRTTCSSQRLVSMPSLGIIRRESAAKRKMLTIRSARDLAGSSLSRQMFGPPVTDQVRSDPSLPWEGNRELTGSVGEGGRGLSDTLKTVIQPAISSDRDTFAYTAIACRCPVLHRQEHLHCLTTCLDGISRRASTIDWVTTNPGCSSISRPL